MNMIIYNNKHYKYCKNINEFGLNFGCLNLDST